MRRLIWGGVCGKDVRISGRFLRVAQLEGDGYSSFSDPGSVIDTLGLQMLP